MGAAADDFIAEHSRQWAAKTIGQNRAYLNILVEYFGPDKLLGTITRRDANEVKKVLEALPASRNTKPKLKTMPLMQVIKEPGHKKIAPKTINSHIQMFKMFFDSAERHGYAPHTLFDKMKSAKAKDSETERKPFFPDQARLICTEATDNPSRLVRKDLRRARRVGQRLLRLAEPSREQTEHREPGPSRGHPLRPRGTSGGCHGPPRVHGVPRAAGRCVGRRADRTAHAGGGPARTGRDPTPRSHDRQPPQLPDRAEQAAEKLHGNRAEP